MTHGDYAGRPFIAMEWCGGVDALAAVELIRSRDPVDNRELKAILLAIVEAYAQLHEHLSSMATCIREICSSAALDGQRSSILARPTN